MTVIRLATVDAPLNRPALIGPAVALVRRALSVGLLRGRDEINQLDLDLLRGIAREASSAGVGQDAAAEMLGRPTPARLGLLIGRLDDALAQSPLPEHELAQLVEILSIDQLAELAGTSAVSLRRYLSGSRAVPDDVAARLHWLALVSGDLAGAYNAAESGAGSTGRARSSVAVHRAPCSAATGIPTTRGSSGCAISPPPSPDPVPRHDRLPARRPALPFPVGDA